MVHGLSDLSAQIPLGLTQKKTPEAVLKNTIFESRVDSAFFNQDVFTYFDQHHVKFSASVPFERFLPLKAMIEERKRWHRIDTQWSYFETEWKPKSWDSVLRFIFTRKKTKKQYSSIKVRFSCTCLSFGILIMITRLL